MSDFIEDFGTATPQSQASGPEGLERGGHWQLLDLGLESPPRGKLQLVYNQEASSFLPDFQLTSLPRVCFPIQIFPTDSFFMAAYFLNVPVGPLARSHSCSACKSNSARRAELRTKSTVCKSHRIQATDLTSVFTPTETEVHKKRITELEI